MKKQLLIKIIVILLAVVIVALIGVIAVLNWYYARYQRNKQEISFSASVDGEVTLMSCNVRTWTYGDLLKKSWYYRADLIAKNIASSQPDVIGFQEVTSHHYEYLTEILVQFDSVIEYRDQEAVPEACPIFYRTDKFQLIDKGSFWLSETPDVMSKDWGAGCYRICSYVILKEKSSGKELIVFNAHLDHVSDLARINGIKVVLDKISQFNNRPAILMGDLNADPDSPTYISATEQFLDAQVVAPITMDSATYQNWGTELDNPRIDYIMASKTGIDVLSYKVVTTLYNGVYPSDHFPILAKIRLV